MMIPAPSPGINSTDAAADESEQPTSDAPDWPLGARPLAYADFSAALKGALRDFHSTDLLARNPLLLGGIRDLSGSVGPMELKALLSETVRTLFDNPRDEKLRRVVELTYFQPAPKQEVVADRLSLSFGTYRRHLTTARDRLTRWLWESWRDAPTQPEVPAALWPTPKPEKSEGESAASPEAREPAPPRLSVVILPFLNIGGDAQDDHFADGITETLTTDLSRCPGVFAISRNTAFAYKGKLIDTRQIGRELGVRYVLEGSVQDAGERMRFNAQLVDAESGAHLWAERFDRADPGGRGGGNEGAGAGAGQCRRARDLWDRIVRHARARTSAARIQVRRQLGRQSRHGARLHRADEVPPRAGARNPR
jgi:TolB-like protein